MSEALAATDGDAGSAGATSFEGAPGSEPTWRDSLPEDLRDHASLRDIGDVNNLVKSFINAQQMIGADKIKLPGESATADEWSDFYAAAGRPDAATNYAFEAPSELPDGFQYSDDLAGAFKDWAFEAGLSQKQAGMLHDRYVADIARGVQEMTEQETESIRAADTAIRKAWGNEYEDNVNTTKRAIAFMGGDELVKALKATGVMAADGAIKNADVAFAFHKVGGLLKEDSLPEGIQRQFNTGPQEARDEIERLKTDKEFRAAWTDREHLGHKAAVAKMTDLQKAAKGELR